MTWETIEESAGTYLSEPWSIIAILALVAVSSALYVLLLRRGKDNPTRQFVPQLLHGLRKPIVVLFLLIAAKVALSYHALPNQELMDISTHVLAIGFILLFGWASLALISVLRMRMLRRYDITTADNYLARKMHTQVSLVYRLGSFLVILVTIAMVLTTFDAVNNVGKSLLASAGVAGLIIGFAAQKTIGSVFAGIQIAITQPIRIEDAVVVEGEWGWVEEITLTYVVIRIWDKRRLIVPITYFTEKPFQNWTRQEAEIIGVVIIHTDYSVPVDEMRKELDRLLDMTPLWNRNVKVLQVVETTPREVQLRALMTGRDSPTTWDLRCFVREGLIAWLQNHYPQALPHTRLILESAHDRRDHPLNPGPIKAAHDPSLES